MRKGRGDGPKTTANGLNRKIQKLCSHRSEQESDQGSWYFMTQSRPKLDNHNGRDTNDNGIQVCCIKIMTITFPFFDKIRRYCPHVKSQKVLYFRGKNDQRDTTGKSDDQWVRDKLDDRSKSGKTHDDEHDTGHECRDD